MMDNSSSFNWPKRFHISFDHIFNGEVLLCRCPSAFYRIYCTDFVCMSVFAVILLFHPMAIIDIESRESVIAAALLQLHTL